jgi:hypothetical protein
VTNVLEQLGTPEQKELLLDMLDTQLCIFLEQVWLQNEQANDDANKPFPVEGHVITSSISNKQQHTFGTRLTETRCKGHDAYNHSEGELLLDHMMVSSKSNDKTSSEIPPEN